MMMATACAKIVLQKTAEDVFLRLKPNSVWEHPVDDEIVPIPFEWFLDVRSDARLLLPILSNVRTETKLFQNLKRFYPKPFESHIELLRKEHCVNRQGSRRHAGQVYHAAFI